MRAGRRPISLLLLALSLALASGALSGGCSGTGGAGDAGAGGIPVYAYTVEASYPHDTDNFTQGLCLVDGVLYEGTGLWGRSRLIKSEFPSGEPLASLPLAPEHFGEGVTVMGDEVFQLTYTSHLCFVYDRDDLGLKRTFTYPTEGWGLSHDGSSLIMSDGTSYIHYLDPLTGEEKRRVQVSDGYGPVANLNELEYIDGVLYANIWKTDLIAAVDPETGKVTAWIDLAGLNPEPDRLVDPYVLNGIAWDPENGHLLVTGKCWPYLFRISLHDPSPPRETDEEGR